MERGIRRQVRPDQYQTLLLLFSDKRESRIHLIGSGSVVKNPRMALGMCAPSDLVDADGWMELEIANPLPGKYI